jgi:hypothetical protein
MIQMSSPFKLPVGPTCPGGTPPVLFAGKEMCFRNTPAGFAGLGSSGGVSTVTVFGLAIGVGILMWMKKSGIL